MRNMNAVYVTNITSRNKIDDNTYEIISDISTWENVRKKKNVKQIIDAEQYNSILKMGFYIKK